ncbi:MAG: LuxR C-terminal-related transcriptional regulator [Aeromicrobium sp.]
MAGYLLGRDAAATTQFELAFDSYLRDGRTARAVRCGFWLGIILLQRGEHARGGSWLVRCKRALDEHAVECVEQGYLLVPDGLQTLGAGDAAAAYATFDEVCGCADRFGDPDLIALGRLGSGQALIAMGEVQQGVSLLDEAMLAVTTADVSPIATGIVYCALIIACRQVFDVRRAQEWTETLSRWCENQQDLAPYRGQCLVHRSEILQVRGEWTEALEEAQQACGHLASRPSDPALGMARYQQGELLRLRGQFAQAEECYRQASEWGHPVQPGLALLRLAQGRVDAATAAIRRVTDEAADDKVTRSRVLAAFVEISLAAEDLDGAKAGADELEVLASALDAPYLAALASYARGSVLLAEGDARAACRALRSAESGWRKLDAPYEAARTHALMSRACRRLTDHDTADLELEAARRIFKKLDAAPALSRVESLDRGRGPGSAPGGLTPREVEVLTLVATGATNREVAAKLVISERTVARHLSNTFVKLDVSSRAAATAYAYQHHIV